MDEDSRGEEVLAGEGSEKACGHEEQVYPVEGEGRI